MGNIGLLTFYSLLRLFHSFFSCLLKYYLCEVRQHHQKIDRRQKCDSIHHQIRAPCLENIAIGVKDGIKISNLSPEDIAEHLHDDLRY